MNSTSKFLNAALLFMVVLINPASTFAAQIVDINRADAATMIENWKGIGEKKARAIVSYRNSNGPFKSVDDLANVTGIGEGIIKNNRKYMSATKGAYKATGKATDKKQSSTKDKKTSSSDKKTKTSKSSADKKSTSKKSSKKSSDKSSTSKSSKSKKSNSKTSKKKKCKPGSKDKGCLDKKSKKKSKKKNSTT